MSDHNKSGIYQYIFLDKVIVKGPVLKIWTQTSTKCNGIINKIPK